jgi:NADPH-dependent 2,4-dienoyl-CoA reductase/sulfur reductase-like enzyme/rhodanese-related sulfurtransferase
LKQGSEKKIVIVGGVACGAKTAARLSRICPEADITLLERGQDLSYANCGFPFYLGGEVADRTDLTHMGFGPERDAAYFENYAFTKALTGHEVTSIDRARKEVTVNAAGEGTVKVFPYDKLVLATGASPIRPDIPGMALANVFTLWTLRDALAIREVLDVRQPEKAVVVGAGLVGVETAESLRRRGLHVTLIDVLPYPLLAVAGPELGALLQTRLEKNGVLFHGGETVKELKGDRENSAIRKVLTEKREHDADQVVVSVGVRPNVELSREAGLALGSKAIRVDEFQRTSDPDIYAGGDCAESIDTVTGNFVWQPMGSTANRQGRVIADHIAALTLSKPESARPFGGVTGTSIVRVFDWSAGKTGLSFEAAERSGFSPVEILTANPDLPNFMPGSSMLFVRLVADGPTRRILGAQIAGPGRVDKRVDVAATALKGQLTVDDLADTDLAYAPPFSSALDPITHAANALRNKMDGLMKTYGPAQLKAKAEKGDDFVVLDVRNEKELLRFGKLPYEILHIPLGELRERRGRRGKREALPEKREIVIVCRAGVRAWNAYSILARQGYQNIAVLEGGMSAWPYETVPHQTL